MSYIDLGQQLHSEMVVEGWKVGFINQISLRGFCQLGLFLHHSFIISIVSPIQSAAQSHHLFPKNKNLQVSSSHLLFQMDWNLKGIHPLNTMPMDGERGVNFFLFCSRMEKSRVSFYLLILRRESFQHVFMMGLEGANSKLGLKNTLNMLPSHPPHNLFPS